MSRFEDDGDGPEYNNAYELWQRNLRVALAGRRGQRALQDLRDALLALPDHRLIARALCTVGEGRRPDDTRSHWAAGDFDELLAEQGSGVCAVGAYAWHQKVKSGRDPAAAFADLPTLTDYDHGSWETAEAGERAGLARTLASHLAYLNDETWGDRTPEQRWQACIDWIDKQLAPVSAVSGGGGS